MSSGEESVFDFGDRTLLALQTQTFSVDDDFGTCVLKPGKAPTLDVAVETPAEVVNPIQRLEQRLDLALRQLAALQQRLDSIDAALARAIHRT